MTSRSSPPTAKSSKLGTLMQPGPIPSSPQGGASVGSLLADQGGVAAVWDAHNPGARCGSAPDSTTGSAGLDQHSSIEYEYEK